MRLGEVGGGMIGRGVSSECFSFSLGFFWFRGLVLAVVAFFFSFFFSFLFAFFLFCLVLLSLPSFFFFLARFPSLVLSPFGLTLRDSGVAHPPFSRLSTVNRCDIISGIHFKHHLTDKRSSLGSSHQILGAFWPGSEDREAFRGPFWTRW